MLEIFHANICWYTRGMELLHCKRALRVMMLLLLLLAGCSEATAAPDAPMETVDVTLTEFVIEADASEIQAGTTVTFNFTNVGLTKHEGVLERDGAVDEPLKPSTQTGRLFPGDTHSFTYTFSEPGVYQLACHIDSHYDNGMRFEITVVE